MSDSEYLRTLGDSEIYLDAPLPLEITGSDGNYVASWLEGKIEGEGATRYAAVEDARTALVETYKRLRQKVRNGSNLQTLEDQQWTSMLHFVGEARSGMRYKTAPGEDYSPGRDEEEYKGPFFG